MKVPAKDLREAFAVCDAVELDSVLDTSQFVRLTQNAKQLTLHMTGALWAEAEVNGSVGTGKWTAYVERRSLAAFLNTASGKEIEIYKESKVTKLVAGQRLELANHQSISGYESWKPNKTYDLNEDQTKALQTATKFLPAMAGTANVEGIILRGDFGLISTDTLYMFGIQGLAVPADVTIPAEVAKYLAGHPGKLGVDKNGVGIGYDYGSVYQPMSSELAKYPYIPCRDELLSSLKLPAVVVVEAEKLQNILVTASKFLMDKQEAVEAVTNTNSLNLTVNFQAGSFQRAVAATVVSPLPAVQWPVKKILPYVQYVTSLQSDGDISIAKTAGASAFRFTKDKLTYILLSADV